MGSHKRSFQCFDAILDEPPLKPSLSYGRWSAASHMGSPALNRLPEDRGCYLCPDHQQATAMTSEASGTYSAPWYHYQTHPHAHQYMSRRPTRPEEAPGEVEDHHHRQSRRIVLVKNSDPAVRRSIVLQRRSLRSLGLFLEEVSELMQCLIRKLYTLDGHKVDSVQSLLQCSSVLVCVGREPFHPLLLDSFRKNSHDKLPKLNVKSRSSVGSDEQTAKKNVNFGLETKRSVIHPRCDSSNRSARLMMSPEKSFPNGLNSMPPGHAGACPHGRQGLMNDDVEKRVLVNKDGSLSMEMKVRFRLLHDETLHWSTEIKKSTSTLNESHIAQDDPCCISHGSAESCSEAESLSAGEAEETYNTKRYQRHFEEPHCLHCSAQSQEYDIWKNPILPDQTAVRHIRSSSSSASSHRIVRKKASSDSMRTMSSEEYTEHVVERATCIEQTFEQQGDTTIKHCTINCCCRRSEVCSVSSKTKTTGPAEEKCGIAEKTHASDHDKSRPDNSKDSQKEQLYVQITEPIVEYERPVSTVSSSSQILASLKEDQDEEDLDLPSISRASHDHGQQEDEDSKGAESNPCSDTPCRSPASMTHLSPRPPSKPSSLGRSKTCQKITPTETDVDHDNQKVRPGSAESALYGCRKSKGLENTAAPGTDQPGTEERALNEMSAKSKMSPKCKSLACSQDIAAKSAEEHNNTTEQRSSSAMSIKSNKSGKSNKSNVTEVLDQERSTTQDGRAPSAMSTKSQKSEMSENLPEDQETEVRTPSVMSDKSNTSARSKIAENGSDQLPKLQDNVEERTASAMSGKSNMSAKSSLSKEPQSEEAEEAEEQINERASNVKSATSDTSGIEELTNDEIKVLQEHEQDRASSRVSVKSSVSQKSKSEVSEAASFQEEEELQDQIASGISAASVQSFKSTLSDVLPAMTVQPHDGEEHERALSAMSTSSNASMKLDAPEAPQVDIKLPGERCLSSMSKSNVSTTSQISEGDQEQIKEQDKEEIQERASSAISEKSSMSSRSRKSKATPTGVIRSGKEMKERASSAMSSQSKASLKSNKSKVSSVAPKEHMDREGTENRASSAMSAKSAVSTHVEQLEQRASSALSAKSNRSATSKGSNVSEVAGVEHTKLQDQDDDQLSAVSHTSETNECGTAVEEKEERTASALSTKSQTSVKSEKSKTSEPATVDTVAEEHTAELRSASAMSSKSNVSAKSVVSEVVIEEPVNIEVKNEGRAQSAFSANSIESGNASDEVDVAEDRAQSIMSFRSNASERSRKEERSQSASSAKSKKSNAAASAAVEAEDKEKVDRAHSAMSGKSHISTKSSVSLKSKASRISEVSPQEPDDEEHKEKASNVLSTKSSISVRSNKSKHLEHVHGDPVEVHNKDRPPSASSTNSNISTKSRSVISEATYKENEITNKGEIKERALNATSSIRTRTSKVSEIMTDEPNQQKMERASSSRSIKSDVSERSNKSNVSGAPDVTESNVEERAQSKASVTSAQSKRSNTSDVAPDKTKNTGNGDVGRSVKSSNVLARSNASTKSKNSLLSETEGPGERSTSAMSSASAASQVSKADVEKNSARSPSQLSAKSNVSARSKKSNISKAEDQRNTPTNNTDLEFTRDKSPVEGHSKVSQTVNSNKCGCEAVNTSLSPMVSSEKDSDHEEIPASPLSTKSAKSKISSTSERVLTPTSTSVSIGIIDDCEDDDVEKTDEGAVSVHSRTPASSQTEICDKSDKGLLESPLQVTNERATQTPQERSESFSSAKSNISDKSKSKCSHCSSTLPTGTTLDTKHRDEVTSIASSKTKNLTTSSDSHPSTNCSVRQSSPTQEIRSSSKTPNVSLHSCGEISAENTAVTGQGAAESPDVSHKSQSICSKCSSTKNKGKRSTGPVAPVSPVLSASATSDSKKSRNKSRNTVETIDRPNSNMSNSSSHLQVHVSKVQVEATVSDEDGHPVKSNKSRNKSTHKNEEAIERCHSATLSVTSGNRLSPSPPKSPRKSPKPVILLRGSNDSVLSQTVPVPDTKEQHVDNLNTEEPKSNRPDRTHNSQLETTSQNVSGNKSEKSSKCRKRTGSSSSCQKMNDDLSEMSPSCLPNASPTEVVNEWLRKIPSDAALCDLGDEFPDNFDAIEPLCTSHVPPGEIEHESKEEYNVTKLEKHDKVEDGHPASKEGTTDEKSQENHVPCEDDRQCIRPQAEDEPKILDSSVLVMKVLLGPRLDRCNSLPEVSPVYGRKLSTAAQGLLDCLAKLQLLDFGPTDENGQKAKYQELMSMLKSLWLRDPKDRENIPEKRKSNDQQPQDEEFKARSSSGVDVNSGSTSSGKSILEGTQAQTNTECEAPDTLTRVQEVEETVEALETPESDIANIAPEGEIKSTIEEKLKDDVPGSDETIRNNDSPRELMETPPSSNISSVNNPKNKEFEADHQEDTSSGSPPAPQRPQLSKRVSQDSDPVWVLNLLNKLEKQFMTHYVNAMDEFKVRWNLDDNEQLDIMICDLQHEVHRRIQSSIDRELKKIQGRAGRPRPPKEAMSRESTAQTEQRRRRLKVMRNQSIDPQTQQSEDDYTATGTDFSDQRSDDEYCPCDTCVKKKMASMPVLPAEMFNSAPVMMDFDLRRILQIKKSAPNNEKNEEVASECKAGKMEDSEENVSLEAVKEEDEMERTEHLKKSAESKDSEKDDDASSTYEDDGSEKQSDRVGHLKKDMNGGVEVISSTEVVEVEEIAEISDNMMTEQNNEGEKKEEKEEKDDDEADSDVASVNESSSASKINEESENISEDAGDVMQVKTKREKVKEKTREGQTEKDGNTVDESEEEGETAEDERETVDNDHTAEAETAGESETAADETAEEGDTATDETAEVSETAEDKIAGESETAEDETAEESETVEDQSAEEGKTAADETAEESETAEDKTAEEGETAEDQTAEEDETAADETAEESETVQDKTAEEDMTAEDQTAEESETAEDQTAEESETAQAKTAEEDETAEDQTAEEDVAAEEQAADKEQTAEDETAEDETAEDETAEECETAEDKTGGESETGGDETAEDGETARNEYEEDKVTATSENTEEDETVDEGAAEAAGEPPNNNDDEEGETADDETSEDGQNAGESETVDVETAEKSETGGEGETANEDSAEDGQTEEETEGEGETADGDTAEECETSVKESEEEAKHAETARGNETAEDETATDGESAEDSKTADDETAEDGQNSEVAAKEGDNDTAEEGETAEDEAVEDEQTEDSETTDKETAAEKDNALNETIDKHTNSFENEDSEETADEGRADGDEAGDHTGETAEEKQTSEAETVDEENTGTEMSEEKATADATSTAEEDLKIDDKNAKEQLAKRRRMSDNGTADKETDEGESELEEVEETGGHDVLPNPEDTGCDDVTELKANEEAVEKETHFKNEGDVVIDSFEDKAKESGEDDDDTKAILGDEGHHCADIGESAEGGDEAEDDTEPDMEIDEREHYGKVKTLQPHLQLKQEDDQLDKATVISHDVVVNNSSVYDADVEDSETEIHNQVQDLSSESESTSQGKTPRKTFRMLIHTLAFLKQTATIRPNVREEEDGDDEDEHEETPEGSDNAEDSSCVEKDECEEVNGKEKGKLSDITEDTAEEEDQGNETGNTTKDCSGDSEWESSENALEKQFTKSSMESQPGSFDEVLDDQKTTRIKSCNSER